MSNVTTPATRAESTLWPPEHDTDAGADATIARRVLLQLYGALRPPLTNTIPKEL